jgi:hypothetical protein
MYICIVLFIIGSFEMQLVALKELNTLVQHECFARYSVWIVGICSWYSSLLWAGGFRDRIPVEVRFSAPVQTNPGAHIASYTMGTSSFPGVKQLGLGVNHPPPSSA